MDRYLDNSNGKKSRLGRTHTSEKEENHRPNLYEAEVETWEFQRDPSGQARFVFSQRPPHPESYRIIGEKNPATTRFGSNLPQAVKTRPNRYNASVKMVSGDFGPAPWDGENVSYKKLPVVGEVAAGRYDVTVAYHEPGFGSDADFVLLNPQEVKIGQETFALRVRGHSMRDNEIENGDIIIVQSQDWAEDGDYVIACLTNSTDPYGFVTLKRFYRHSDRVVLQPANPELSPIHILPCKGDHRQDDLDGVKIQGRVTAIIKTGGLI